MVRPSKRTPPQSAAIERIASLLGVTVGGACRLLTTRGVPQARGVERYALDRVAAALTKPELAAFRRRERDQRMAVRTSKNWLAGFRDLVAQWHPTKNGDLFPDEVGSGSTRRIWWKCAAGPDHEWSCEARGRARAGRGCPFCAGQRVSVTNCIRTVDPALARQWDPHLNGKLTADHLTAGSLRLVWWRCPAGPDHSWRTSPKARRGGVGCPFCAGLRVSVTNSLASVAPDVAKEWLAARNGRLRPDRVVSGSTRRVWWKCLRDPTHVWQALVRMRARHGTDCPFCVGHRAAPRTSLAALHPAIAAQWDHARNGDVDPASLRPGSSRRVGWICPRDDRHRWEASVADRTHGHGCPFCGHHRAHATNSLKALAPEVAAEWHPTKNGTLGPEDVLPGSGRHVWWRCRGPRAHVWKAQVASRARGTGCPGCWAARGKKK